MGKCNTRERVRESSLATNLVFSRVCEEFDINDFEVLIGETLGEEVKYTRTFYVRKNELSRFWI